MKIQLVFCIIELLEHTDEIVVYFSMILAFFEFNLNLCFTPLVVEQGFDPGDNHI